MRHCKQVMDELDQVEEPVARLVWEYGLERAMRAVRQFYGRWDICRKHLEEERQRNERFRWEAGKGTLPQGW